MQECAAPCCDKLYSISDHCRAGGEYFASNIRACGYYWKIVPATWNHIPEHLRASLCSLSLWENVWSVLFCCVSALCCDAPRRAAIHCAVFLTGSCLVSLKPSTDTEYIRRLAHVRIHGHRHIPSRIQLEIHVHMHAVKPL